MVQNKTKLEKWNIIWFVVTAFTFLFTVMYFWQGFNEQYLRSLIRTTARCSVTLFLLAFSASSLFWLSNNKWTRWIRKNRRYIGLSFALSHFTHLMLLAVLAIRYPAPFLNKLSSLTLIAGGIAYVFILAMTITSFEYIRKQLQPKTWKILHTLGSYYICIIFAQSYITRAIDNIVYIPISFLILAVLVLRIFKSKLPKSIH